LPGIIFQMSSTPSTELKNLIEQEDFEGALELFKSLKLSDKPTELLLLIKTGSFREALKIVGKEERNFPFEISYCYYRLSKYSEALDTLSKVKKLEKRDSILKGQILYRLGRYEEAAQTYKSLLLEPGHSIEEEKNLRVNFEACLAGVAWSTGKSQGDASVGDNRNLSHYILFNKGTMEMAIDQQDALLILKASLATAQKDSEIDPDDLTAIQSQIELIENSSQAPLLPKRLSKKMTIFQKQLIIEKQILALFETKKFHSLYNLWKKHNLVLNLERVYPLVQVSILKCKRLHDVSIKNLDKLKRGEMSLEQLNSKIYSS
jgi:tetratricopeptide (TPR) repeat protein